MRKEARKTRGHNAKNKKVVLVRSGSQRRDVKSGIMWSEKREG